MGAVAGSSSGALTDATMYSVPGLAPFTNLVATLDMAATPFGTGAVFQSSGHVRTIGGTVVDRTGLVTNVYEVTQQTTLAPGGLSLGAGDMIFSYTIDLVSASASTVDTLGEFQVGGFTFIPGLDAMDGSSILGRGFLTPALSVTGLSTPLGGNAGDLEDLASLGSSLDWQWSNDPTQQLDNSQSITLLMFTSRASIGVGEANLISPPIQQLGVNPVLNGAPVLIPTAIIPAPGGGAAFLLVGLVASIRRRR